MPKRCGDTYQKRPKGVNSRNKGPVTESLATAPPVKGARRLSRKEKNRKEKKNLSNLGKKVKISGRRSRGKSFVGKESWSKKKNPTTDLGGGHLAPLEEFSGLERRGTGGTVTRAKRLSLCLFWSIAGSGRGGGENCQHNRSPARRAKRFGTPITSGRRTRGKGAPQSTRRGRAAAHFKKHQTEEERRCGGKLRLGLPEEGQSL